MHLQHKPTTAENWFGSERYTVSTHEADCPACDEQVVDGQGVLACTDCDWVGIVA